MVMLTALYQYKWSWIYMILLRACGRFVAESLPKRGCFGKVPARIPEGGCRKGSKFLIFLTLLS